MQLQDETVNKILKIWLGETALQEGKKERKKEEKVGFMKLRGMDSYKEAEHGRKRKNK